MFINRSSGVPLYIQLKDIIIKQLEDNLYMPGDLMPTEADLQEKYSLSRTTVRSSLKELEFEGYLLRYPGKGTIVSHKKNEVSPRKLMSYSEEMLQSGLEPSNKVISLRCVNPSNYIRDRLSLNEEDLVWEIRRLKYADGIPMATDLCYIPVKIINSIERDTIENKSMFDLYNNMGFTPTNANEILSSRLPNAKEASLLEIHTGVPLFVVIRTTYHDQNSTPLEYVITCFRSDRYQYNVEI